MHVYRDGTVATANLRKINSADEAKVVAPVKLWDYIEPTKKVSQKQRRRQAAAVANQARSEVDLLSTIPVAVEEEVVASTPAQVVVSEEGVYR